MFEMRWERGLVGIMPGMLDLLDGLRDAGIRLWGLTNWAADRFAVVEQRFPELFDRLGGVIVSGREGMAKPDESIYRLTAQRFELDGAATVFVDDVACNIDAACAAGWHGIRFRDAERTRMELRGLGVEL